jgi:hypothetical protein
MEQESSEKKKTGHAQWREVYTSCEQDIPARLLMDRHIITLNAKLVGMLYDGFMAVFTILNWIFLTTVYLKHQQTHL